MTIEKFLAYAIGRLKESGIETARLDVLMLLEDELGLDRAHLLAHLDQPVSRLKILKLNKKIAQRCKHVPLAYIRGEAAFYGRDFAVNKHVLVPRPESEAIIDLLKKSDLPARPLIADIGSGSGCLGLTAALEFPSSSVELYDIDSRTLGVAKSNARRLGATVVFKKVDLLGGLKNKTYDAVLANLPYVPQGYKINRAAAFEPTGALFAGTDGLDAYRRFWAQIVALKHKPARIITEALRNQHEPISRLAAKAGYRQTENLGLAQLYSLIR